MLVLDKLLHDLAVVNRAVIQKEGDLYRGVSDKDLADIIEQKALGVDRLWLHDIFLDAL